jgi:hypothetical protein
LYNGSACAGNQINEGGGGGDPPPVDPCSGANYYNEGCPGYNPAAPIIRTIPTQVSGNALIAMQNAINLQLLEEATLRIYDMKGKMVLAKKIEKGNNHVQLQLPRGLYIAKATSGSWKQTIKVAMK